MNLRQLSIVGASALALGFAPILSGIAMADPAGCTKGTPSINLGAGSELVAQGSGGCADDGANRAFTVEIKWDKSFSPDPLVAKNSDVGAKTTYGVTTVSCDAGNRRGYYARAYYAQTAGDQSDSGPRDLTAC